MFKFPWEIEEEKKRMDATEEYLQKRSERLRAHLDQGGTAETFDPEEKKPWRRREFAAWPLIRDDELG